MVTLASCMASSNADWVFGGVRLISSASSTLAKIGPGTKRQLRSPVAGSVSMISVPCHVGGHEIRRELDAFEVQTKRRGERLNHERLGGAGEPGNQAMAADQHGDQQLLDHLVLADDDPAELGLDATHGVLELGHQGLGCRGVAGCCLRVDGFFGHWVSSTSNASAGEYRGAISSAFSTSMRASSVRFRARRALAT